MCILAKVSLPSPAHFKRVRGRYSLRGLQELQGASAEGPHGLSDTNGNGLSIRAIAINGFLRGEGLVKQEGSTVNLKRNPETNRELVRQGRKQKLQNRLRKLMQYLLIYV